MKFYKDSATGKWMLGTREGIPAGTCLYNYDSATELIVIEYASDRTIFARLPYSEFLKENGDAYASKAEFDLATADFFVKTAGGISSGIEVIDALGYTPADEADLNTLQGQVDSVASGFLGAIAYNATAPTPAKSGYYVFSNAGVCSWLSGSPTVKNGDKAWIQFTSPSTYVRTYENVDNTISDFYNVSVRVPLTAGSYYTPSTARNAVPSAYRKLGLTISYVMANKEVDRLTLTALPTVACNANVVLNGVSTLVAVDPATETTLALLAAKIALIVPSGWAVSYTAGNTYIDYTKTAIGTSLLPVFSDNGGDGSMVGSFTITTLGRPETWVNEQFINTSTSNWTLNTNWKLKPSIDLINSISTKRLLSNGTLTGGKFVDKDTGTLDNWGACTTTSLIDVKELSYYYVESIKNITYEIANVSFWDANNKYIKSLSIILENGETRSSILFFIPTGVKKIRLSFDFTSQPKVYSLLASDALLIRDTQIYNLQLSDKLTALNAVSLVIGKNKYNYLGGDNVASAYINSSGIVTGGNGNGGVTGFIRIKPGETLVFPGYTSAFGGYSGLYDIDKNPIAGTFVQSGTIAYQSGAYYVRYSGNVILAVQNGFFCYDINNPISAYEQYTETIDPKYLPTSTLDSIGIEMYGDSIGSEIGGYLNGISPIEGRTVNNNCIGGESVLDTMARLGCLPYIAQPFTIPAGTTPVSISLTSAFRYTKTINPTTGLISSEGGSILINPYGTLSCEIAGILGTLTFVRADAGNNIPQSFSFTRTISGTAKTVNIATPVKSYNVSGKRNKAYCIFMGTNGGWKNTDNIHETATIEEIDNLVNFYRYIADWIRPTNNDFVFLGFYMSGAVGNLGDVAANTWFNTFEDKMDKQFGLRYINVRKYLMTDAIVETGISLTADDITRINAGKVPSSFLSDGTHLTDLATKAVANKVLRRFYDLGILNNVNVIS